MNDQLLALDKSEKIGSGLTMAGSIPILLTWPSILLLAEDCRGSNHARVLLYCVIRSFVLIPLAQ